MLRPAVGVVLAVTVAMAGRAYSLQTISVTSSPLLRWVRAAKEKGLSELHLPPPEVTPTGVERLSEVIRDYTVVRFVITDRVPVTTEDGVRTWYRLQILERVIQQRWLDDQQLSGQIPSRLLPLAADEILMVMTGGIAVMEGMKVIHDVADRRLLLRPHQEYVGAFYLEYCGKLATPAAGAAGIFAVANQLLQPQGDESHPLVKDVQSSYKNRLEAFRRDLKRRAGRPNP